MKLLTGKEAATRVRGMLHPKFQVHGYAVDLTVRQIFVLTPAGRVDFSGSEYSPAGLIPVESIRENPEDRYELWELARGTYYVEFNESLELAEDEVALLEPHDRLLRAGASHASVFLRGRAAPVHALLQTDVLGLSIKQNARLSRVLVFHLGSAAAAASRARVARSAGSRPPRRKKPRRK